MRPLTPASRIISALLAAVAAGIVVFAPLPASAQTAQYSSVYTKLDLDQCTPITNAQLGLPEPSEEELGTDGGRWACLGYNNELVYVAEGDLRMFVSFGLGAMQEVAAEQTLAQFNTIGETLEWRLVYRNDQWVPFATILRWKTQIGDGSEPDGEVLIVTKLEPGNVCHVAHVDARKTPDANEVARQFADTQAPGFDCSSDKIFYVPE
ncbi:MAG TPA: hypothetical protein ENJ90_08145 [Devosia sp.]|nr:hypothetical protein [Devosia sp.]